MNKQYEYLFNPGDKIKYIGGLSEFLVVRFVKDLMIMKPLNDDALYNRDTVEDEVTDEAIRRGWQPSYENEVQVNIEYQSDYQKI